MSTITNDQNALLPISHWPPSMPNMSSTVLAAPLGWRMNRHTTAVTNDGITYGTRNSDRTRPRPRNVVFTAIAASRPIGIQTTVVSTEKDRLIQIECSKPAELNASM